MLENLRVSLDAPSGQWFGWIEGKGELSVAVTPSEVLDRWLEHQLELRAHAERTARAGVELPPDVWIPGTEAERRAQYDRIPAVLVERFVRELASEKLEDPITKPKKGKG